VRALHSALAALVTLGACGGGNNAVDGGAIVDPRFDPRPCSPAVHAVPDEGRNHVDFGTRVAYQSNPPASGPHWPAPHAWGIFLDQVVPREWWVHNLEHGGIVLLVNCPSDAGVPDGGAVLAACPDIVSAVRQVHDERSPDEFGEVRILVTNDPLAPSPLTEIAWDWIWEAAAPDLAVMRCFRDARYGQGPEQAP
jgi:hypothetical protein